MELHEYSEPDDLEKKFKEKAAGVAKQERGYEHDDQWERGRARAREQGESY
jgi:hypothetical protein